MRSNRRRQAAICILAICSLMTGARGENWPMFRGSQALLGVAKGSLPPKLTLLWSFNTGGPVKSSPAIEQNQVFIGSGDGNVYALNLTDGKKLWDVKTGGAIESSPLVLQSKVYIGSSDSWLYAFDAKSGNLCWKYQTGEKILGAPNWVKAGEELRILVGSYDFKLHCVEAAKGQVVWTYESGNYINGSPAVADNKTVFGGCDALRSEERRVGKEGRSRWSPYH